MNSPVSQWLVQDLRPSVHSICVVVSNIAFLSNAVWCVKTKRRYGTDIRADGNGRKQSQKYRLMLFEASMFFLSFCVSTLYHLCDEGVWCLGVGIDSWHFADIYITFVGVITVAVSIIALPMELESVLRSWLITFATILIYHDRFHWAINAILWLVPVFVIICCYSVFPFCFRYLYLNLKVWKDMGANVCFPVNRHELRKSFGNDVSIADGYLYWIFHSTWHVMANVASRYILYSIL
eukprot:Nk52_evm2s1178 gene=Nk52_evmTU2s1178